MLRLQPYAHPDLLGRILPAADDGHIDCHDSTIAPSGVTQCPVMYGHLKCFATSRNERTRVRTTLSVAHITPSLPAVVAWFPCH